MRVGITTTLASGGRSGIGRYLIGLIDGLLRAPSAPELVLFVLEQDLPVFEFATEGARIVVVGSRHRSALQDLAWHQIELPRLAQSHGLSVLHTPSQRRLLWRQACPLVATVHDVGSFRTPRDPLSRGSCPGAVFRALARRQDELVTVNQYAAEELRALLPDRANRISSVPIGIDSIRFANEGHGEAIAALQRMYGIRPPFFVQVAKLEHPAENHARVIRAFEEFKAAAPSPWQLAIVGAEGGTAARIRSRAERSPYAPDIRCIGAVPGSELVHWYRAAGALIYPPLRWEFGFPALEAMACGCVVVAADTPAARELCGPAALYTNATSEADLQGALTSVASDAGLRELLRARGQQRAASYSWHATATATAEIYARAVRRAKPALSLGRSMAAAGTWNHGSRTH
jgi:glycosyltransferase involved in cell wall biosynthesis